MYQKLVAQPSPNKNKVVKHPPEEKNKNITITTSW